MKEIAGDLRRDVKDLPGESASIVTGFFKNGLSLQFDFLSLR